MSKGHKSRVKNHKEFGKNLDEIQKNNKGKKETATKIIKIKNDWGNATRYYYS